MWRVILLVGLVAVLISAQTNSTDPFMRINNIVDNILKSLDSFLQNLKEVIKVHIVSISKSLAVILGLIGSVLYFSGLSKYSGRGMIIGAVLLYLLSEYISSL